MLKKLLVNILKDWQYSLFLLCLLIFTLFSSVSNYSPSSFYLKCVLVVPLAATLYLNRSTFTAFDRGTGIRNVIIAVLCIALFFLLSLIYSLNAKFGLLKIFNFLLSNLPLIIGYYFFFASANAQRNSSFATIASFFLFISALFVVLVSPFTYTGFYSLSISNWSHIIYGRFVGLITLLTLVFYLSGKLRDGSKTAVLRFTFLLFLNFIISHRSSLLGINITAICLTLLHYKQYAFDKKIRVLMLSALLVLPALYVYSTVNRVSQERMGNLISYVQGKEANDEPIQTRQKLYARGIEIIKQHWLIGVGFGGYNNAGFDSDLVYKKYPHNIFLEFWIELGIPGVMLFLALIFVFIRNSYRLDPRAAILLIYPLVLAMFSKDIANQTFFSIFAAAFALPRIKKKEFSEFLFTVKPNEQLPA